MTPIQTAARPAVLLNNEIAELMSYPDMDMFSPGKQNTACFLALSDQYNAIRFASAML